MMCWTPTTTVPRSSRRRAQHLIGLQELCNARLAHLKIGCSAASQRQATRMPLEQRRAELGFELAN